MNLKYQDVNIIKIIKTPIFKVSFMATIAIFSMIYCFLIAEKNIKVTALKNNPSIFRVTNLTGNNTQLEFFGERYELDPRPIHLKFEHEIVVRSLIPKEIKLAECILCYTCSVCNEIVQYEKNNDFIENTK